MAKTKNEYFLVFQQKFDKRWRDLKFFKCNTAYRPIKNLEFEKYLSDIKKSGKTFRCIKRKDDNIKKTVAFSNNDKVYQGPIKLPNSGKVKYLLIFQKLEENNWIDVQSFPSSSTYIPKDYRNYMAFKNAHKKKPNTRWIKRPIFNQKESPLKYAHSYFKIIQEKLGNDWIDLKQFKCKNSLYELVDGTDFENNLSVLKDSQKETRVIKRRVRN